MAHHIETHGTQAAAVFARQDAWHQLGTTVAGDAFTAEEAMRLGHLGGWDVRTVALNATEVTEDGMSSIGVPNRFATVRTNPFTGCAEALGVVGSQYQPIQNEEHAEVLNRLVDDSGAIFDTAGSLKGGRQVFITMRLPQTIKVAGVDEISINLGALNSHDGSQAFRLLVTPVRIVCANTQHAALRDHRASVVIRHTVSAAARIAAARDALGMTFEYVEAFEAEAEAMINQSVTDAQFVAITRGLFGWKDDPSKNEAKNQQRREAALLGLWAEAQTQTGIRHTAWAGYQAVAEYVDHVQPVRTKGDHAIARAERLLTTEGPIRLKTTAWAQFAPA
ncbi:DUF932 domain-containing protein [Ornithinimicrobium sp. Y1847]|uniref:DUF932 domain-containing protein n=1 Tax=Ornithinimicrobium sp. Y1847 TaxID=3405419 RepID=UPI003B67C2EC